jgi:hypothetical protein
LTGLSLRLSLQACRGKSSIVFHPHHHKESEKKKKNKNQNQNKKSKNQNTNKNNKKGVFRFESHVSAEGEQL